MRVLLQRVSSAKVDTAEGTTGAIGLGLLVFLAVGRQDTRKEADYLIDKILGLRIFPDDEGRFDRSLRDVGGALLIVSQFTLYADCSRGRRPGFDLAAPPQEARALYEYFVSAARSREVTVATGEFQASMKVTLVNEGPVTIWLDTNDLRIPAEAAPK
jgi:D-tyrosyl-tRNA(Tyr) deacylase